MIALKFAYDRVEIIGLTLNNLFPLRIWEMRSAGLVDKTLVDILPGLALTIPGGELPVVQLQESSILPIVIAFKPRLHPWEELLRDELVDFIKVTLLIISELF